MKISIKNLRETKLGVRCDRIGAYGNPFDLVDVNDDVARDNVCDAYDDFFYRVITHAYGVDEAISIVSGLYDVTVSSTWKNYSTVEFIEAVEKLVGKAIAEDRDSTHGELSLLCWCRPKRCHTETLREYLKYRIKMARNAKQ